MRDRYTITERLDHGGMAEVFRGVAESMEGFKKSVAIKRILPNLTKNQKFVSMFLDEARLSLFLQHANIVQVFDISRTPDNAYFLVMEYVDGCNLKALIERQKAKNKRLEVAHTIYMMMECCKALNYARFSEQLEKQLREKYQSEGIGIYIVGFAKIIGDLIEGTSAIVIFFAITWVLTAVLQYAYCRCWKSTAKRRSSDGATSYGKG